MDKKIIVCVIFGLFISGFIFSVPVNASIVHTFNFEDGTNGFDYSCSLFSTSTLTGTAEVDSGRARSGSLSLWCDTSSRMNISFVDSPAFTNISFWFNLKTY